MSTLKSIVGDYHAPRWRAERLDSDDLLVQFHDKFWGVSMDEEVNNWRESAQDEGMDNEDEHDEQEGNSEEEGNDADANEGEQANEEEGENEEEEDEEEEEEGDKGDKEEGDEDDGEDEDNIIDGCYVLDVNIPAMETSIWVRAEYIRIFDHIAKLYKRVVNPEQKDPKSSCVILTGQPGIGKSKFLIYAMRRCCAEQRPFIFYRNETCYLFVREGVFEAPSGSSSHQYRTYVWALVDADEATSGVPEGLVARFTLLFTVYSTSPARSRWARVHKTVNERVLVMNPWARKEILRAAPLRLDNPDFDLINELFDELGPIPRLCIEFNEDELEDYREDLNEALNDISVEKLEELAGVGKSMKMDVTSHKVCLIRRFNSTKLQFSKKVKVSPITPYVGSRIAFQLKNAQHHELIRLYKKFIHLPSTRKMSGDVFGAWCHQVFCEHISIKFDPMVCEGGSKVSEKKNQPQWHTTNMKLTSKSLESKRRYARRKGTVLDIRPGTFVEYTSPKLHKKLKIKSDVYYSPEYANEAGFDSFIVYNHIFYLFQFTVKPRHDIKDFLKFFNNYTGIPSRENWRFIFVRPLDVQTTLKCPFPSTDALRKLALYSAEVEMTESTSD